MAIVYPGYGPGSCPPCMSISFIVFLIGYLCIALSEFNSIYCMLCFLILRALASRRGSLSAPGPVVRKGSFYSFSLDPFPFFLPHPPSLSFFSYLD